MAAQDRLSDRDAEKGLGDEQKVAPLSLKNRMSGRRNDPLRFFRTDLGGLIAVLNAAMISVAFDNRTALIALLSAVFALLIIALPIMCFRTVRDPQRVFSKREDWLLGLRFGAICSVGMWLLALLLGH